MRQKKPFPPPFYRPPSVPDWLISAAGTNAKGTRGRTPADWARQPAPLPTRHGTPPNPRSSPAGSSPPSSPSKPPQRRSARPNPAHSSALESHPGPSRQRQPAAQPTTPTAPQAPALRPRKNPAVRQPRPQARTSPQPATHATPQNPFSSPRHLGNSLPGLTQLRSRRRLRA